MRFTNPLGGRKHSASTVAIGFQQRCGFSTVSVPYLDVFLFLNVLFPKPTERAAGRLHCSAHRILFKSCNAEFPQKTVLSSTKPYCWRFSLLPQSHTLFTSFLPIDSSMRVWELGTEDFRVNIHIFHRSSEKIKWWPTLLDLFSDHPAQLEHENQRTEEPAAGSLWLCLYFRIWETFPVSRPGHLPWARWLPVGQNLPVPFSVRTHMQTYALFLRRVWARKPECSHSTPHLDYLSLPKSLLKM